MKKKYVYAEDTVRAFKWKSDDDIRSYRPKKGWEATADLLEYHPITGKKIKDRDQWWIIERKI